jgi:hypothetical protein
MVLDARLARLAAGISARKAAKAFVREMTPDEDLSDLERSQSEEFKAILEGMFLMAAVDGEVASEEVSQLGASIAALMDMHQLEAVGVSLEDLLAGFADRLAQDGWTARLDAVAQRLPTRDGKAFAFRLAAGVAMVDDKVAHSEAAAIDAFATALHISPDESQQILREVVDELFGSK